MNITLIETELYTNVITKQIQRFGSKVKIQEWNTKYLRIPFEKNSKNIKNYFNDLAQKTVIAYETGSDVAFLNSLDNSFTRLSNIFRIQYNVIAREFKNITNRTQNVKDFDTEFEIALHNT